MRFSARFIEIRHFSSYICMSLEKWPPFGDHFFYFIRFQMHEKNVLEILTPIVEKACEPHGAFLVSISVSGDTHKTVEISVQTDAGINSQQSVEITRSINEQLGETELFESKWDLQVGSPGLGEPLTSLRALNSQVNRLVEVNFPPESGQPSVIGYLKSLDGQILIIEEKAVKKKEEPKTHQINFSDLLNVIVQIEW